MKKLISLSSFCLAFLIFVQNIAYGLDLVEVNKNTEILRQQQLIENTKNCKTFTNGKERYELCCLVPEVDFSSKSVEEQLKQKGAVVNVRKAQLKQSEDNCHSDTVNTCVIENLQKQKIIYNCSE